MIKTARNIRTYKKRINEALNDRFLRSSLDKFYYAYRESRQKIFEGIGFEDIKESITSVKED